ncbi:MAG: hypothetical protein JSU94_05730 [Phycisphaerales bacterium]|nr:MAG: hypothetical protein JSU94_05730 [Phycisphaerales bacterium]
MKNSKFVFLVVIVVLLILSLWLTPWALELRKDAWKNIGYLLGTMFVIALFLERALDVFLTTWRADGSEQLDLSIEGCRNRIAKFEARTKQYRDAHAAEAETLANELEEKNREKQQYRSKTRLIAMWSGLVAGILISAGGIRTLRTLVEPLAFQDMPTGQRTLFHLVDILLTAGLIAGGGDGIHKLTEAYRAFMETTTKKAKA